MGGRESGSLEKRRGGISGPPHSILIVGMGSIGGRHLRVLRGMYPLASYEIVSRRTIVGETVHPSLGAVPDIGRFDYLLVCSETVLHEEQFREIERRVTGKTVLIEKPLFAELIDVPSPGNDVYIGYNLRFHPALHRLRSCLEGRKILSIQIHAGQYLPTWRPETDYRESYSASRKRGGGVLRDLSHEIDYLQWLAGPLRELHALDRKVSDLEISADDLMCMIGVTERGIIASLSLDYLSRNPRRIIVVQCDDATYVCDLIKGTLEGNSDQVACSFSEGLRVMKTIRMVEESEANDWKHV
jgi:CMP-N,N'-diacetyllegionaminic acid synthase